MEITFYLGLINFTKIKCYLPKFNYLKDRILRRKNYKRVLYYIRLFDYFNLAIFQELYIEQFQNFAILLHQE